MSDFNIQFEEQDQSITLEFEQIGGGAVKSVNGKTGVVVLDAGDLEYDDTETYSSGSVGDELSTLKDGLQAVQTEVAATLITDTASGAIASFSDGADGAPVKSLTVDIEPVQSGSNPSPTNICPISGHSTAMVTRTGKNVLKPWITNQTKNGITYTVNSDGSISTSGTASDNSQILSTRFVLPKGDYILNGCPAGGSTGTYYLRILLYRGSSLVSSYSDIGNGVQFTVDDGMELITFVSINNGQTAPSSAWYPMIRPISITDATYESYTAETYIIDLDGTRYGGTLDATTGVLTVDRAMVDLGSLIWTYYTSGTNPIFYAEPSGHRAYANGEHTEAICENYAEGNPAAARSTLASGNLPDKTFSWISGATGSFTVRDSSYTSASDFKTAMNGVKLVYPLATPFEVTLTGQNITTVKGQNNVWADTGDVEIEYRADTKLYIEKLTAPTEDDMIADHAISANTFFMVGNSLYRATTAIASGATITVGTNATKMSLSDALNALS